MRLISVATTTTMPNQMRAASGVARAVEAKSSSYIRGAKTGTVSRIIDRLSSTEPRAR